MKKTSLKKNLMNLKFRDPQSFPYHINVDIRMENKEQVIQELQYIIECINKNQIIPFMGGESNHSNVGIRFYKWDNKTYLTY